MFARVQAAVASATRAAIAATVMALAGVSATWAQTLNGFDLTGALVPPERIEQGGPPKDGIPAIDRPRFMSARQATFLRPESRVLGVRHAGIARAYPIAILNWHEVVNDRYRTDPVVVTFCPLCGTGMVFSGRVDGRVLRFGVSGLLYNSDVLLFDRATDSLWSQILGQAVTGPMKGQRFVQLAAAHTTWADWRRRHPETEVLSPLTGYTRDYGRDPYAGYDRKEDVYFSVQHTDRRYHPKESVIGIVVDGEKKAYPFVELARSGGSPLDDTIAGRAVRVEFDAAIRTGRIVAADGREIPSVIAYWFAWYAFHPDTAVHRGSR